MKHESHCTRLATTLTTRESTVWSGSAAAMRLLISCRMSMSEALDGSVCVSMVSRATGSFRWSM